MLIVGLMRMGNCYSRLKDRGLTYFQNLDQRGVQLYQTLPLNHLTIEMPQNITIFINYNLVTSNRVVSGHFEKKEIKIFVIFEKLCICI